MNDAIQEGWLTIEQAVAATGYGAPYLRQLAQSGRIEARKVARDWLVNVESLRTYQSAMQELGSRKHDPAGRCAGY